MQFLSYQECVEWCRARKYPVTPRNHYGFPEPAVRDKFRGIQLEHPVESNHKVSRAERVIRWMAPRGDLLLWINDWDQGIHHAPLFRRFREGFGERRPFIEAPGHLVRGDESDDAVSIVLMALVFSWDCTVLAGNERVAFFCSHDDWSSFFVHSDFDPTPLLNEFAKVLHRRPGDSIH